MSGYFDQIITRGAGPPLDRPAPTATPVGPTAASGSRFALAGPGEQIDETWGETEVDADLGTWEERRSGATTAESDRPRETASPPSGEPSTPSLQAPERVPPAVDPSARSQPSVGTIEFVSGSDLPVAPGSSASDTAARRIDRTAPRDAAANEAVAPVDESPRRDDPIQSEPSVTHRAEGAEALDDRALARMDRFLFAAAGMSAPPEVEPPEPAGVSVASPEPSVDRRADATPFLEPTPTATPPAAAPATGPPIAEVAPRRVAPVDRDEAPSGGVHIGRITVEVEPPPVAVPPQPTRYPRAQRRLTSVPRRLT